MAFGIEFGKIDIHIHPSDERILSEVRADLHHLKNQGNQHMSLSQELKAEVEALVASENAEHAVIEEAIAKLQASAAGTADPDVQAAIDSLKALKGVNTGDAASLSDALHPAPPVEPGQPTE